MGKITRQGIRFGLFSLGLLVPLLLTFGNDSRTALSQSANPPKATFTLNEIPKEGRVGLRLVLNRLEIKNSGTALWPVGGANPVKLGYRWFYANGGPVPQTGKDAWEDIKADLPQDILPDVTLLFPQFVVSLPASPGDYILHLNLLQGGKFFSELGSPDFEIKLLIKPRDTTPPTASISQLPLFTTATTFPVSWSGNDEPDGSGLATYDLQFKSGGESDWRDWLTGTTLTSAPFTGENGKLYLFRARATDRAGNTSNYPNNEQAITRIDALPPVSRINNLPLQSAEAFLLRWSSYDNVDQNGPELYDVQYREGSGGSWIDWLNATPAQASLFQGVPGKTYFFRVRGMDYAGNQEEFPAEAVVSTTINTALDSLYAGPVLTDPVITPEASQPNGQLITYFPLATKNGSNGAGTSGIVLKNPGTNPITISLQFTDRAGAPLTRTVNGKEESLTPETAANLARLETFTRVIPPGGTVSYWSGNITATVMNGWASVQGDGPFQAQAIRLPGTGAFPPVIYAPANALRALYLPSVRKGDPNSSSIIDLANPNQGPAEFTITYFDTNGLTIVSENHKLNSLANGRFLISNLAVSDPNLRFNGSAIISSNLPLVATVETVLEDGSVATYPAVTNVLATTAPVTFYNEVDGITTALAVQNTGKEPANVKIEYLGLEGQVLAGSTRPVGGNGRLIFWPAEFPEIKSNSSGKVRITSSGPTLAVLNIGVNSLIKGKLFP